MENVDFKKLDSRERRELILNVAAKMFAAKGYDAVTILELSDAIGCTETMLLSIFPAKTELYDALFQEWHIIVQQKMVLEIINDSALDTLEKFYNEYITSKKSRSVAMRPNIEAALVSRKSDGARKKIVEVLQNAPDYVTYTIEPVIQKGQQNGEIVSGNSNDLATLFWTIILGTGLLKEGFGERHKGLPFSHIRSIFSAN